MSAKRNELLLCALRRAGKPLTAGDAVDAATGLAIGEGWDPAQLEELTTKAASKLLQNMVGHQVITGTPLYDETCRRAVPSYPVEVYDTQAPIPESPRLKLHRPEKTSPYAGRNKVKLLAILETHDDILESVSRFFADLSVQREKARRRFAAAGFDQDDS
jgi:hypothetical protein